MPRERRGFSTRSAGHAGMTLIVDAHLLDLLDLVLPTSLTLSFVCSSSHDNDGNTCYVWCLVRIALRYTITDGLGDSQRRL